MSQSVKERLEALRGLEQSFVRQLTGPSHGVNRPALSRQLASVRRQIAMLTEEKRKPMGLPEQGRRFA